MEWIDLGPIEEMAEGEPLLRKADGRRFVCVRSGEGDRWFANVQVPNGSMRSRPVATKQQLVSVRVIQTMENPTPYGG